MAQKGEFLNFKVSTLLENDISGKCTHDLKKHSKHFILKPKDILRYTCIKSFSGLSFNNPGEIYVFSWLSFKNLGEICHNQKSGRDLWEKNKSQGPPGESGRVGSYA